MGIGRFFFLREMRMSVRLLLQASFLFLYWLMFAACLVRRERINRRLHAVVAAVGGVWLLLCAMFGIYPHDFGHIHSDVTAVLVGFTWAFGTLCGMFGCLYNDSEIMQGIYSCRRRGAQEPHSQWIWILTYCLCAGMVLFMFLYAAFAFLRAFERLRDIGAPPS